MNLDELEVEYPTNLGGNSVIPLAGLITVLTLGAETTVVTLAGDTIIWLTVLCGRVAVVTLAGLATSI